VLNETGELVGTFVGWSGDGLRLSQVLGQT
jgi:hypothetical protein